MAAKTFTTIARPSELVEEIDRLLVKKLLGFRNRPEFIKQGIRDLILKIKAKD